MVKYCMNLQTGSVREGSQPQEISPRATENLQRLIDPRAGEGFRRVAVPLKDLPVELQPARGRLRNRITKEI